MNKYQQYEIEKKKLQAECMTVDEYEKKLKKIIDKLKL